MPQADACSSCGNAAGPNLALSACTGCSSVQYCSKECQREHWKKGGHKESCLKKKSKKSAEGSKARRLSDPAEAETLVAEEVEEATLIAHSAAVEQCHKQLQTEIKQKKAEIGRLEAEEAGSLNALKDYKAAYEFYCRLRSTIENEGLSWKSLTKVDEAAMANVVEVFEREAFGGNSNAQLDLGFLCVNGHGVDKSARAALSWFHKASQKEPTAFMQIAIIYDVGSKDVEPEYASALGFYAKCKAAAEADGDFNLARRAQEKLTHCARNSAPPLSPPPKDRRPSKAVCANCGEAPEPGFELAICSKCKEVGYCSRICQREHWKKGGHRDECEKTISNNVRKAAEDELKKARSYFAQGIKFYKRTEDLIERRESGSWGSITSAEQDTMDRVTEAWTLAGDLGEPAATYNLGRLYRLGHGVEKSNDRCIELWTKAAELGYSRALCDLDCLFRYGLGVTKSIDRCVEMWTKAAEQNNSYAQFELGKLYWTGHDSFKKNKELSLKWLSKAAEQGHPEASLCAVCNYSVDELYRKGLKLYNRIKDDVSSGKSSFENLSTVDREELKSAALHIELAAGGGSTAAAKTLGYLYLHGYGVENNVQAHKYWTRESEAAKPPSSDSKESVDIPPSSNSEERVRTDELKTSDSEDSSKHDVIASSAERQLHEGLKLLTKVKSDLISEDRPWEMLTVEEQGVIDYVIDLFKLASPNCPKAAFELGSLYLGGYGVGKNVEAAFECFQLSADHCGSDYKVRGASLCYMGLLFVEGACVEKNLKKALELWRKAAELGHVEAQMNVGSLYLTGGGGVEVNLELGENWLTKAAEKDNLQAQCHLASMYAQGWYLEKNITLAKKWALLAARQGDSNSQYVLGMICRESREYEEAIEYLEMSAKQDNAASWFVLGTMHTQGEGLEKNPSYGIQCWEYAAYLGEGPSQINSQVELGKEYLRRGELQEAKKWVSMAAKEGDSEGEYVLGMVCSSLGDRAEAAKNFTSAAEKGHTNSAFLLGGLVLKGIEEDCGKKAQLCFLRAAEKGHDGASLSLGLLYLTGTNGATVNTEFAKMWLSRAADQGNEEALLYQGHGYSPGALYKEGMKLQFGVHAAVKSGKISWARLANADRACMNKSVEFLEAAAKGGVLQAILMLKSMYSNGRGVEENLNSECQWLQRAAEQGHAESEAELGKAYFDGKGVEKDAQLALTWWAKAARHGHVGAKASMNSLRESASNKSEYGAVESTRRFEPGFDVAVSSNKTRASEPGTTNANEIAHVSSSSSGQFLVSPLPDHSTSRRDKSSASKKKKGKDKGPGAAAETVTNLTGAEEVYKEALIKFNKLDAMVRIGLSAWPNLKGKMISIEKQFQQAAEAGNTLAQYQLGRLFGRGDAVRLDPREAVRWLFKASDQGHVEAPFELAELYEIGKIVPADFPKALQLYELAAERGHLLAQSSLGHFSYTGEKCNKDYVAAAKWWNMAAQQGCMRAQYNLGHLYETGRVDGGKNVKIAFQWYTRAAEQGLRTAQLNVAQSYHYGEGVEMDLSAAIKWYKKLIAQGSTHSYSKLGEIYSDGKGGIEPNYRIAELYFMKGADADDVYSQYRLGEFYENKAKGKFDLKKAMTYYKIAKANVDCSANLKSLADKALERIFVDHGVDDRNDASNPIASINGSSAEGTASVVPRAVVEEPSPIEAEKPVDEEDWMRPDNESSTHRTSKKNTGKPKSKQSRPDAPRANGAEREAASSARTRSSSMSSRGSDGDDDLRSAPPPSMDNDQAESATATGLLVSVAIPAGSTSLLGENASATLSFSSDIMAASGDDEEVFFEARNVLDGDDDAIKAEDDGGVFEAADADDNYDGALNEDSFDLDAEFRAVLLESETAEANRVAEDDGAEELVATFCAALRAEVPSFTRPLFNPAHDGDCLVNCAVEHDFGSGDDGPEAAPPLATSGHGSSAGNSGGGGGQDQSDGDWKTVGVGFSSGGSARQKQKAPGRQSPALPPASPAAPQTALVKLPAALPAAPPAAAAVTANALRLAVVARVRSTQLAALAEQRAAVEALLRGSPVGSGPGSGLEELAAASEERAAAEAELSRLRGAAVAAVDAACEVMARPGVVMGEDELQALADVRQACVEVRSVICVRESSDFGSSLPPKVYAPQPVPLGPASGLGPVGKGDRLVLLQEVRAYRMSHFQLIRLAPPSQRSGGPAAATHADDDSDALELLASSGGRSGRSRSRFVFGGGGAPEPSDLVVVAARAAVRKPTPIAQSPAENLD